MALLTMEPLGTTVSERTVALDHDIREVTLAFGATRSRQAIEYANFGTTTIADITHRRIDPLHEPLKVADERLQSRLESLCEALRAKY